jgi:hypothetical protein
MAQEPRRDQPVRLPNPSAQPFVVALKTARFYAVLLFWVTAVCVLANATTFVLTEWIGLYDIPGAAVAPPPAPAAVPAEQKTLPEPAPAAAKESSSAQGSWLDFFENTAHAEVFVLPDDAKKPEFRKGATSSSAATSSDAATVIPPPVLPPSATEGKVAADTEARPVKEPPPTAEKRVQYRVVTAGILKSARIVGTLASLLLAMTIFLYLQITLLGRLAGIRQLTNALFLMLLFLATALPWENVFEGIRVSSLYEFNQLWDAHSARFVAKEIGGWEQAQYFGRFFATPLVSLVLLAWSGIQFAAGYGESVLSNE